MALQPRSASEAALLIIMACLKILHASALNIRGKTYLALVANFDPISEPEEKPGLAAVLADHAF
jgi:hypothetical protein